MTSWLWPSILIAAILNTIIHESAHILLAQHLGGRWRGLRWHHGRLSSAIDMAGLSLSAHRRVALVGVAADLFLASLAGLLLAQFHTAWAEGPFIWASASVLVNGCPLIPHSDGWQVIFGARHFANPRG